MDIGITTTTTLNNRGSELTKQEKSHPPDNDHHHFFHPSKSSRTDYFDQPNNTMSLRSDSVLPLSLSTNNMLCFSTTNKDANHTPLFSFYQPSSSYITNTNTGYGYGGLQGGMHMPVSRFKGPFTPSQWMELEHQALIYKHFVANVPVPSNLLNPLRKSLNSFIFPGSSSSSSYAPNSYGWGGFHLGFAGTTDPEPGRCRRTDGKKWRCSRDAVPDQKYCERHINRGRHRSRKPVESQNGQSVSGATASKARTTVVSSSSVPVSTRTQEPQAYTTNTFSVPKHDPFNTNYGSLLDHAASNTNPLPSFVDEWSKDGPVKPDWTQLSMSIPISASDFSSSSNSPAQEKLAVPPLGLTPKFDLGSTQRQAANWIPISWGSSNSMGGPLGEVLNRTSSNGVKFKNQSSGSETKHITEMWDGVSYDMGSGCSPTGVLQKSTFVSLSNSSSGSSPKGNKKDDHGDQLLVSTLANI